MSVCVFARPKWGVHRQRTEGHFEGGRKEGVCQDFDQKAHEQRHTQRSTHTADRQPGPNFLHYEEGEQKKMSLMETATLEGCCDVLCRVKSK